MPLFLVLSALLVIAFVSGNIFVKKAPPAKPPVKYKIVKHEEKKDKKPQVKKAKIAIVLDDFGYTKNNLADLGGIKYPLTLSILPNLAHSADVARFAKKAGMEVILHLPMEPETKNVALEKDTILTTMTESEIREIVKKDIDSLPNAKGVSNHMGSKATKDKHVMESVLKELKRGGYFFLDSVTTNDSVCKAAGKDIGVATLERDIFLDNKLDENEIKNQVDMAVKAAIQKESCVAIGHDRGITIRFLKVYLPQIAKNNNVEVVPLSRLIE